MSEVFIKQEQSNVCINALVCKKENVYVYVYISLKGNVRH